jgi:hypothetical protein
VFAVFHADLIAIPSVPPECSTTRQRPRDCGGLGCLLHVNRISAQYVHAQREAEMMSLGAVSRICDNEPRRLREADKTITFSIATSTFPNWDGADQKRPFTLAGDQLKYTVPAASGGGTAEKSC